MRLCVIGDPVGHSLSPRIHRRFMERCGAAGSYEAVTVTAETLEDLVVQGCRVTVCARTPEKAAALAARCGGVTVSWEDLPRAAAEYGLLLNATPLGMEGSPEFESLDFVQALPAKAVVYDLVYHPTDTALMRAAEHRGLTAVGGLALLVQQAALSFAHFTGIVPDAALCRDILQELEAAQ